ncbi:hypothetical protein CK203_073391 [Vitis vinifera]|uniref:Ubiquitin-like protease family profile domain-containing protein n=1 Tax=Vitis vinifera TaxID=29760 RepID=A0A438ESF2_VITVI|nr:hypothetical protein CK203_073391 [Vitis vinifera]
MKMTHVVARSYMILPLWTINVKMKSELLVNFQYEHANREDFMTLGSSQELLDMIINVFACKLNTFEKKFKGIQPSDASYPLHLRDDMRTSSVRTVVEECAHFFNLNGHLKNLSSVPIERPTWVDVQANGWDCGVHVINHMRRSDFMDSSSTPSHWDSTAIDTNWQSNYFLMMKIVRKL